MNALVMGELTPDVPEPDYHAHDSLSSTGAKRILVCPATYRHEQDNRVENENFDHGHVIHELILGKGEGYVVVDGNRNTKAVREEVERVRAEGKVPIKTADLTACQQSAAAVLEHPEIGPWFTGAGVSEVSALVADPRTGVPMRARFDRLIEDDVPVILDVKSTRGLTHPWQVGKAVADYGYHVSAAFYRRVARLVGLPDPEFRLVFTPKSGPFEAHAYDLADDLLEAGDAKVDAALDLYAACRARDEWPCLYPAVSTLTAADLPAYAL